MKKKVLILLTLMLFCPFIVNAYEVKMDWQKNLEFEPMKSYFTKDSGIIVIGESYDSIQDEFSVIIEKVDKEGNVLYKSTWNTQYSEEQFLISLTNDGGFILYGYVDAELGLSNKGGDDAIIIKYDKEGNVLWQKYWGGNKTDKFNNVELTKDGGYITVGETWSTDIEGIENKGSGDALIVKYDKDGNILWQKSWGGNDNDGFDDVVITEDGGFIAVGYFRSTDVEGMTHKGASTDAIIVKYDKDGNMLWEKNWGGSGNESFDSLLLTKDDGVIAVGESTSTYIEDMPNKGEFDGIMVKYDKDGNMLYQKNMRTAQNVVPPYYLVLLTEDDGVVALGQSTDYDVIIVKYDKDGNILWEKSWGGNDWDGLSSVPLMQDGGFIAVMNTSSTDIEGITNKGDYDIVFVKYDKEGNMLWQKNWGMDFAVELSPVFLTEDVGILAIENLYSLDNSEIISSAVVKYSIEYNLEMVAMENKTFIVEQKGKYGVITPTPNEGYEVDKIIVKDTTGNEIEVTKLEDGTYSFELYDDVTIEVSFGRSFRIDEKDYVNGKADIIKSDNNVVVISPTADKGYELDKIIVKNSKDEIVEVTKLEDGTYSFELNDDVTVEVLFKEEVFNPKTGVSNIIGLLFTMALCFISGFFVLKNYNKSYEI